MTQIMLIKWMPQKRLLRSSEPCWICSSPAGTHQGSRYHQHPGCCASRWVFVLQHPTWGPSPCRKSDWCNAAVCILYFCRQGTVQILFGDTFTVTLDFLPPILVFCCLKTTMQFFKLDRSHTSVQWGFVEDQSVLDIIATVAHHSHGGVLTSRQLLKINQLNGFCFDHRPLRIGQQVHQGVDAVSLVVADSPWREESRILKKNWIFNKNLYVTHCVSVI